MIFKFFADRKIRKFVHEMARELPQRYGGSVPYSEGQIATTMEGLGYNKKFLELGVAIFSNDESYKKLGLKNELRQKYDGYRETYRGSGGISSLGGFNGGMDGD